jgi:hypothetical protein
MRFALLAFILMFGLSPTRSSVSASHSKRQCSAGDLQDIVGYLALTSSNVVGDFEGADFDKLVELDNGMIFRFQEYKYSYSYRPEVIVFSHSTTYQGRAIVLYKLLIDEDLYDVTRVR